MMGIVSLRSFGIQRLEIVAITLSQGQDNP